MRKDEAEFVLAGTVYEDPTSGERTEVLVSPPDTGDRYRVRLTIGPASRPERHRHPTLTEAFVVRDGEVRLRVGREMSVLYRDDRGVVPAGVTHAVWNSTDRPAVMDVDIVLRPEGGWPTADIVRFGAAYVELATAQGRVSPLRLALLLDEFPDAYVLPGPVRIQRLIIGALAGLARRRAWPARRPAMAGVR
jgi:quercetin dioxygenase-like cupin family protein